MGELRASKFQRLASGSVHVGDVSPLQLRTFCTKHQSFSIFLLAHHRILRIHRSYLPQHRSLAHLLLNSPSSLSRLSLPRWHCKDLLGPSLGMRSNCDKPLNQFTTESLGRLAHLLRCSLREYVILQGQKSFIFSHRISVRIQRIRAETLKLKGFIRILGTLTYLLTYVLI